MAFSVKVSSDAQPVKNWPFDFDKPILRVFATPSLSLSINKNLLNLLLHSSTFSFIFSEVLSVEPSFKIISSIF